MTRPWKDTPARKRQRALHAAKGQVAFIRVYLSILVSSRYIPESLLYYLQRALDDINVVISRFNKEVDWKEKKEDA